MKISYKILFLIFSICFSACVKDLDFDQAEDIELEPAIAISLLNFDFGVSDINSLFNLIDLSIPIVGEVTDEIVFSSFEDDFFQEDLDRIVPVIEGSNGFDVDFAIVLAFLDEFGNEMYSTEEVIIPANSVGPYFAEEVVILNNPDILNSTKVVGTLILQGVVNPSEGDRVVVNTGAIFHFSTN